MDRGDKRIGHNPLGGWSVAALLTAMLLQVGLGLFASDVDGLETGPLADRISFDAAREIADLHELNFNLLLGLVALHLAAILFFTFVKRENLVGPMLSGSAEAEPGTEPMRSGRLPHLALALAAALGLVWWISLGAPF